jgi:hypothetical protein
MIDSRFRGGRSTRAGMEARFFVSDNCAVDDPHCSDGGKEAVRRHGAKQRCAQPAHEDMA